jgi:hypothetical protein
MSRSRTRNLSLALAIFVILSLPALAQDRVENASAGIALNRPPSWQEATTAAIQANRERVRLSDAEFQRAMVTRSALPIIALMKYPEPFAGLNPSIQITVRQALKGSPTALLAGAVAVMRRGFADLRIVQPVESTTVSGLPAATVRVAYTLRTASQSAPVLSRLWLVPRGSLMFLIGMSGAQTGPDLCESEFADVLESIRIDQ